MPSAAGSTRSGSTSPSRTTHTDDVVAVVSSSRPSSPRNTSARVPRAARTPASTGAMRRSAQPTAAATGRAGLVSGPRKLKTVPMPISRRVRPACRMPGWNTGAKKKPIPASSTHRATRGGRQVDDDAEGLQHVGGPGRRRRGAVAVLGDRHPRGGGDDGGHRGDVDRVRAVAAGADDVDARAVEAHRRRDLEHRGGHAGHLLGRLALRPERHDEAGDLRRASPPPASPRAWPRPCRSPGGPPGPAGGSGVRARSEACARGRITRRALTRGSPADDGPARVLAQQLRHHAGGDEGIDREAAGSPRRATSGRATGRPAGR